MVLQSSATATLVGVRSDAAASVSIIMAGARGASMDRLPLPPGEVVTLAPGGVRLRLLRLGRNVALGDRIPLVLTIEAADGGQRDITIDVEARRRSPLEDERHAHKH